MKLNLSAEHKVCVEHDYYREGARPTQWWVLPNVPDTTTAPAATCFLLHSQHTTAAAPSAGTHPPTHDLTCVYQQSQLQGASRWPHSSHLLVAFVGCLSEISLLGEMANDSLALFNQQRVQQTTQSLSTPPSNEISDACCPE